MAGRREHLIARNGGMALAPLPHMGASPKCTGPYRESTVVDLSPLQDFKGQEVETSVPPPLHPEPMPGLAMECGDICIWMVGRDSYPSLSRRT